MLFTVFGIFAFSLVGITALFSLKLVESRVGREFFPTARRGADSYAVTIKRQLIIALERIEHVPVQILFALRALVHVCALSLASLARRFERAAESLAENVSHKRHFQAGETRSEFLRQVSLPSQTSEVKEEDR